MTFESHNPATGELVGTYPEHDEAETDVRFQGGTGIINALSDATWRSISCANGDLMLALLFLVLGPKTAMQKGVKAFMRKTRSIVAL